MSSRFTKKSLVSASGRLVKIPCCVPADVGLQNAHAADEHRHFGRGQGQQLRLIDQQRFGRYGVSALEVIAEAVGNGFEHGEGFDIGLLLRGVHASRRERNRHFVAGILCGLLDAGATGQHDQVRQRDLLAARLGAVERALDAFQRLEHLGQLGRLIDFPILLRRQANAGAVRAAALVEPRKVDADAQAVETNSELRTDPKPGSWPSARRCPAHRSIRDSPRGWGPAR